LNRAIRRQRAEVRDRQLDVDVARASVDRGVEQLRDAVRECHRAMVHLDHLLDWQREIAAA